MPTPADLFLSPDLTEAQARAYLESLGFRDPAAVDEQLQKMADDLVVREALGRLAPDLLQSVLESPDPDAAVAGVAHYVGARTGRAMFLDYLREDPRALHVLTYVTGASPVLTEILIRTPEYFHWLVAQVERSVPDRQDHEEELVSAFSTLDDPAEALDVLRRWKRREILRIGTRDLLRRDAFAAIAAQLSDVACVAVDFALALVTRQLLDEAGLDTAPGTFAVTATGQLGAHEMSYSSDIELLYVFDAAAGANAEMAREFFTEAGRELTAALSEETREGYLYRVTLPSVLPADASLSAGSLEDYTLQYARLRDTLQKRPLTRARAIAGDADLGHRFVTWSESFVYGEPAEAAYSAHSTDRAAEDVERFTQWLQLRNGMAHPAVRRGGTLASLDAAGRAGLIDEAVRRELDHAYVILRSAEHRAQLGVIEDVDKQLAVSRDRVREICRAVLQQEIRRSGD